MAGIKGQPGTKPDDLFAPPSEEEMALFAPPSPEELKGLGQTAATLEQSTTAPEDPGALSQGLDYATRALDYPGGFIRSGLAQVAGMMRPTAYGENPLDQSQIVTPQDLELAVKGKAPSSEEYLKRLGVPEGGSVTVGGERVTMRGAAGLAADIATDPLTAIAKAVKSAPYIGKLINAVGEIPNKAVEALGEAVYKSAFSNKKVKAAADVLVQEGAPIGGKVGLAKKVEDLSNTMGKLRQGLYDRATQLGAAIETNVPFKRAEAVLERMGRDPSLKAVSENLNEMLLEYKKMGSVPIDIMSEWKSNLYDALPASAFNGAKLKGQAKMFKAALAADFRENIIKAGNKVEKGLGDSINTINEKWGALLSATQPMQKAVDATGGKLGHIIDGAVAAAGGPKAYVIKKGFDLATGPAARTLVGKALMEAGKKDLAARLLRQSVIETQRPEVSDEVPE